MDDSNPPRCLDCATADRQQPHDECRVCRDFRLIETLQKKMKVESARIIRERFPEIGGRLRKGAGLWDQAYFVETIG